jgi:micrococcal nuclease
VRVVDGDTLLLDGGERVRLIGVDTPETVRPDWPQERFGNEASAFTRRMAERKRVWLEYDPQVGRKDRYERTLAYVYLPDGTLLNREIIRRGYGHVYTRFPFSRIREFKAAEREAREKGLGLWAGAPSP